MKLLTMSSSHIGVLLDSKSVTEWWMWIWQSEVKGKRSRMHVETAV